MAKPKHSHSQLRKMEMSTYKEKLSHPAEVKNGKYNFQHNTAKIKYTANILEKNILNSTQLFICALQSISIWNDTWLGAGPVSFHTLIHYQQSNEVMKCSILMLVFQILKLWRDPVSCKKILQFCNCSLFYFVGVMWSCNSIRHKFNMNHTSLIQFWFYCHSRYLLCVLHGETVEES